MKMVVIYFNPKDFPDKYVAREWELVGLNPVASKEAIAVCDSLDEVRNSVPEWMVKLERHPDDDPVIVETWV